MKRLLAIAITFVPALLGCSSGEAEPVVNVDCIDTETCSGSICAALCEDWGEVVVANCYKPAYAAAGGECYCLCEEEGRGRTCFAYGDRGAGFTYEWVMTETECGGTETCDSVCEVECVWGFGATESRCEDSLCECFCGMCHFTG
jgi:hypothetical protein